MVEQEHGLPLEDILKNVEATLNYLDTLNIQQMDIRAGVNVAAAPEINHADLSRLARAHHDLEQVEAAIRAAAGTQRPVNMAVAGRAYAARVRVTELSNRINYTYKAPEANMGVQVHETVTPPPNSDENRTRTEHHGANLNEWQTFIRNFADRVRQLDADLRAAHHLGDDEYQALFDRWDELSGELFQTSLDPDLSTDQDAQLNRYRPLLQDIRVRLDRLAPAPHHEEHHDEHHAPSHELIGKGRDAHLAVLFFDTAIGTHKHPEWENGSWVEHATADELAEGLFQTAMDVIIIIGSRGYSPYIKGLNILAHHLHAFEDEPSIGSLLESFGKLGFYFRKEGPYQDRAKAARIEFLAARLGEDFAQIQEVFKQGLVIRSLTGNLSKLGDYLVSKDSEDRNVPDPEAMRRIFVEMGTGYTETPDPENNRAKERAARKTVKAFNITVAMNEPIFHRTAVLSNSIEKDPPIFLMGVNEHSEDLAYFPEESPLPDFTKLKVAKRRLVQMLAGEDGPLPWEFATTYQGRLDAARNYLKWKMYGDPALPATLAAERGISEQEALQQIMLSGVEGIRLNGRDRNESRPSSKQIFIHPEDRADAELFARTNGEEGNNDYARSSFYGRFRESGLMEDKDDWLTDEERQLQGEGYLSELIAYNMYVWGLEHGRADAAKMVTNPDGTYVKYTYRGREYTVVNVKTGPLGDAQITRPNQGATYRNKVISNRSQEGAGGPRQSKDAVFATVDPLYDARALAPRASARTGVQTGLTLKQAMFMSEAGDVSHLDFLAYLGEGTDNVSQWGKEIQLGYYFYEKLIKGFGIDWSKIKSRQLGSELTYTFAAEKLEELLTLSRNVYYLMTRDFGTIAHSWATDADHGRYITMEQQFRAVGGDIERFRAAMPEVTFDGVTTPVDQKDIDLLVKLNSHPSERHIAIDARPLKGEDGEQSEEDSGMIRIFTTVHLHYRIAATLPEGAELNDFEKVVFSLDDPDQQQDTYLAYKKALIGILLMSDISRNNIGINAEDSEAIAEFLSFEYWATRHPEDARKHLLDQGKSPDELPVLDAAAQLLGLFDRLVQRPPQQYKGLGFFSPQEAYALLKAAGVNTGWYAGFMSLMERVKAFK